METILNRPLSCSPCATCKSLKEKPITPSGSHTKTYCAAMPHITFNKKAHGKIKRTYWDNIPDSCGFWYGPR